ncbi:hypothetical protein J0910_24330 [Nocardiopsis sp. CNT-189]|uniref:hypothetical protein n=1 Tax=Nocardiopsis oceanisediminis TaxID=2816862 RepID=UPI003B2BFB75
MTSSSAPAAADRPGARPCTVALLADAPPTGRVGDARARRFPLTGRTEGERSAAFVEFAAAELEAGRKVVAVHPDWRSGAAIRAVRFARARGLTDGIAPVGLALPPLALSFLADQLAYLARFLPPGAVAAMAGELPHHMFAGACLRRVGGLSAPPASLAQHAGSLLPGSAFIAVGAPVHRLLTLRPGELAEDLPPLPGAPLRVVSSSPGGKGSPVFAGDLLPVLRPHSAEEAPEQPLAAGYWGTGRFTEFVAFSAHPEALAYAARTVRTVPCRWCGEHTAEPRCPFCGRTGHRVPPREPPLGGPPSLRLTPVPAPRSSPENLSVPTGPLPAKDRPVPLPAAAPEEHPASPPAETAVPPLPLPGAAAPAGPGGWLEPPPGLPVAPNGRRGAHPITAPDAPAE